MARRNESNEEKNRRKLVENFSSENPIKVPNDIQEMMRQVLEGGLTAELDDELGYTRYNHRNKETENSRNGYSKKTVLMPKHKNTLTQDIEAKIISMYAKGMTTGDIETHIKL